MLIIYVTDTTVWIDYYGLNDIDVASRENVEKWVDMITKTPEVRIILTTVVLCEIIRRLFYLRQMSIKEIRLITRTLRKSFPNVMVAEFSSRSIHDMVESLDKLPRDKECYIGEMSVLSELMSVDTIVVSSDVNALNAYKFVGRLNPRIYPHTLTPAGVEIR